MCKDRLPSLAAEAAAERLAEGHAVPELRGDFLGRERTREHGKFLKTTPGPWAVIPEHHPTAEDRFIYGAPWGPWSPGRPAGGSGMPPGTPHASSPRPGPCPRGGSGAMAGMSSRDR